MLLAERVAALENAAADLMICERLDQMEHTLTGVVHACGRLAVVETHNIVQNRIVLLVVTLLSGERARQPDICANIGVMRTRGKMEVTPREDRLFL